MELTPSESVDLALAIREKTTQSENLKTKYSVVLCPTFTALEDVGQVLTESNILLGAQDVAAEEKGALTGEVSARELHDIGCAYCIVGHSERRANFGETDDMIHHKIQLLIQHGITPILCVGETAEERATGKTNAVVDAQLAVLGNISTPTPLLIAYEPRWVIGTGKPVSVAEAEEVIQHIRTQLGANISQYAVLYGGAVDAASASAFLASPLIEGLLIGTASRKVDEFTAIICG